LLLDIVTDGESRYVETRESLGYALEKVEFALYVCRRVLEQLSVGVCPVAGDVVGGGEEVLLGLDEAKVGECVDVVLIIHRSSVG
jgi:hypothetical protein